MKENHADALETAVLAGNILLGSGAEIFRVEDTILRIAHAYGVHSCNTFIFSSGIFTTAGGVNEEYFAKVKHIPISGVRLDKVEAVNQLSREIVAGQHSVEEAYAKLMEISVLPKRNPLVRIVASGIGCASFCFLFGGSIKDCLSALVVGMLLYSFLYRTEDKKLSKITRYICGGALITLCAIILCRLGLGDHFDQIIIGSIMPMIPGVSFTNAIRDIADGDYIAGSVRMLDALLITFCIAGGVGIVYTVVSRFFGGAIL
ncbi:MAG: threonine/serine exporter family protein [Angelakisella sp.]